MLTQRVELGCVGEYRNDGARDVIISTSSGRMCRQRKLDTITCDGNYYGLIAFHNTVKGVMYGESGFV